MGLFDKKYCDVCGAKIGLLGNRKLDDGNLCKDCAAKLSPWFTDRRRSTVNDIKEQLQYREDNKADVASFRVTHTFGRGSQKVFVDANKRVFCVCYDNSLKTGNPDIIACSSITNCVTKDEEHKTELRTKNAEGRMVSYNPPRYEYTYDWYATISVDHPYIDDIKIKLNDNTEKRGTPMFEKHMNGYSDMCREMKHLLHDLGHNIAPQPKAAPAPAASAPKAETKDFTFKKTANYTYKYMDTEITVPVEIEGNGKYKVIDEALCKASLSGTGDLTQIMSTPITMTLLKFKKENLDVMNIQAGLSKEKDSIMQSLRSSQGVYGIDFIDFSIRSDISDESIEKIHKAMAIENEMDPVKKAEMLKEQQAANAPKQAPVAAPASDLSYSASWECPACGGKSNTGKFCMFCGSARP